MQCPCCKRFTNDLYPFAELRLVFRVDRDSRRPCLDPEYPDVREYCYRCRNVVIAAYVRKNRV
jgi:hypothetical protein